MCPIQNLPQNPVKQYSVNLPVKISNGYFHNKYYCLLNTFHDMKPLLQPIKIYKI